MVEWSSLLRSRQIGHRHGAVLIGPLRQLRSRVSISSRLSGAVRQEATQEPEHFDRKTRSRPSIGLAIGVGALSPVREGIRIMFKPALFALGLLGSLSAVSAHAASDEADVAASPLQYRVTVLHRGVPMFEGEGRMGAGDPLALRQFVLARDNEGRGQSFVDSGVSVVLRQMHRDTGAVASTVNLDVDGQHFDAPISLKLVDEASSETTATLGGYLVKIEASVVQPKAAPLLPEDFAYLAPSLSMESLSLPNVAFDRGAYQVANAVLERGPGSLASATLVAPKNVARAADAAPLLAQR